MLELTMATVAEADDGATAGMLMAHVPSEPGAVMFVGRDAEQCRLVTPQDWMFVSRTHLEFRCAPDLSWTITWQRGSQADPSAEVRLVEGGRSTPLAYGGTARLTARGSGEIVIQDRMGPRSVNVGWYHEL